MSKLVEKIIWIFFLFMVFDAPLRFFFVSIGAPLLIYLKDILMVGLCIKVLLNIVYSGRINKTLMMVLILITYGIASGLLNQLNLPQVLFGVKIMLTFLVGFIVVNNYGIGHSLFRTLFQVLIPIILLGLILEILYDLPWKGMEYEIYGTTIETSRQRGTFGLPRLSGFGRSSFDTAYLLYSIVALYLGGLVYENKNLSWSRNIFDILLLVATFLGILITTTKSAILTYFLLILFYLIIRSYHHYAHWFKFIVNSLLKSALYILFLYGIIPPIIAFVSPSIISRHLVSDNIYFQAVTSSYVQRLEYVWPEAFDLLSSPYQYFTGRGIGGIGAAQYYFEKHLYNPADNLYVYLLIDFGIVILAILMLFLLYKIYISRLQIRGNINLYFLSITLFGFGATVNLLESGTLFITIGFMLAMWQKEVRNDN